MVYGYSGHVGFIVNPARHAQEMSRHWPIQTIAALGVLGGNVGGCAKSNSRESKKRTWDEASQL
jgi:hypothetical protein